MRKGIVALSIWTGLVALTATFSTITYAGFSNETPIDGVAIHLETKVYMDISSASPTWAESSVSDQKFAVWVWGAKNPGEWADYGSFMTKSTTADTLYYISIPYGITNAIFVKLYPSATYPAWNEETKKFQTVNITLDSTKTTYSIGNQQFPENDDWGKFTYSVS